MPSPRLARVVAAAAAAALLAACGRREPPRPSPSPAPARSGAPSPGATVVPIPIEPRGAPGQSVTIVQTLHGRKLYTIRALSTNVQSAGTDEGTGELEQPHV